MGEREPGAAERGISRDLEEIGDVPAGAGLAAAALELARELDDPSNSLTSKSMATKALIDTMSALRELAPPRELVDGVSRLADARAARRAERSRA